MVCCITEQARIEAQIKTAEAAARMRAEEELRQQREKEREAARVAIEKVLLLSIYCKPKFCIISKMNIHFGVFL